MTDRIVTTYTGWLKRQDYGEGDALFLDGHDEPLAAELGWTIGHQITVRYWACDEQCTKEDAIAVFMGELAGAVDLEFYASYSEITGFLWMNEHLWLVPEIKQGGSGRYHQEGHDLMARLDSEDGRWLILEIESDVGPPENWEPDPPYWGGD